MRPRSSSPAAFVASLAVALGLAACTADDPGGATVDPDPSSRTEPLDPPPADDGDADDDEEMASDPVDCTRDALPDETLLRLETDALDAAAQLVDATATCAATVVVAPDEPLLAAAAASLALAESAQLLLTDGGTPALLDELAPDRVLAVGPVDGLDVPDGATVESVTSPSDADAAGDGDGNVDAAVAVADLVGTDRFVAASEADPLGLVHALTHLDADLVVVTVDPEDAATSVSSLPDAATVLVPSATDGADALVDALTTAGVDAELVEHAADEATATTWLLGASAGADAAAAVVTARQREEQVLAIDHEDLRRDRGALAPLRASPPDRVVLVGDVTEDADWQLTTVTTGTPLPWGGFSLFDDERMVALYGSPETSVLGAMGEQDLDATVVRLREVAEPYGADGATVLPAFEIISTIASAEAGAQGDYSRRTPIETIRPWVDRAAEEGFYVILDLQPGRTDFLTQAQEYEELLREPHVGLALDPEWRLEPDQVHLRQIGSVSAAEVQQVADWLADLTRDEALPQKLLLLHQFRFSMLPDREAIVAPPELAVVVHMDGQGPIGTKYETYAALTAGHEDRWLWGWKNFYDEDSPTPTPEQVLALDPLPVFVSYQ